jgi:hypothetical protein
MVYKVPAATPASKRKKVPPFRFEIGGKEYSVPAFSDLLSVQELIDLAERPFGEQNGVALQRFTQRVPKDARAAFATHEQFTGVFNAWRQHGQAGESSASAD